MPPAKTLRGLGLGRGMSFLDVGCGPGYFSIPACGVVGKYGRVLACDVSPVMVKEVRERAFAARGGGISTATPTSPRRGRDSGFRRLSVVRRAANG